MGNTSSNVTSGVKKQAESSSCALYSLVDLKGTFHRKPKTKEFNDDVFVILKGGGLLVELMKQASKTKDFSAVDKVR